MIPDPASAAASGPSELNRSSSQAEGKSSEAVDDSEDESGNENRRRRGRRRKRTRTEAENVTSKKAKSGRGRGRERPDAEAVTLFDVIAMGPSAMAVVIDGWKEAYAEDRDAALLDLVGFFVRCCGCRGVVTAEMCHVRGDGEAVDKMLDELEEDPDEVAGLQSKKFLAFPWILTVTWPTHADSGKYPLSQPAPRGRRFHSDLSDFVRVLVRRCGCGLVFDSYLMTALVSLLSHLSDCRVRAFRHTCTLAAVKLLSSLIEVAADLSVGLATSQDLQRAPRPKRQKARAERARHKAEELREKRAELEGTMDVLFKAVFLKRYRDVHPEIRSLCVEELALWMRRYSSVFLSDCHLKYLDWASYDKVPDVRLKCVLGLQSLYGDPALLPQLDLFTARFKDRLISMTLDKDHQVALQAMKLLLLISKTCPDVLSSEDQELLLRLVYCSQRPLAAAAGELLFFRLVSAADDELAANKSPGESPHRQSFARLKALLDFFQASKLHEHVVYLVDSLWDCSGGLLKDWPAITSLLLRDPRRGSLPSAGLAREQDAALAELALASVRQASEGPAPVGRTGAKKVMSSREKKVQLDDCAELTRHFLSALPQLLAKFSDRPDVLASLMTIPQYFLPESPEARNAQSVSGLLSQMRLALEFHADAAVLEAASRSFLRLCAEGTAWAPPARAARDSVVRDWLEQLRVPLSASLESCAFSADEGQTGAVLVLLRKLCAFHNCHDLSSWNVFGLLSPLLPLQGCPSWPPPQVLKEVLQCLCYCVLWSLSRSGDIPTSREDAERQRLQLRVLSEASRRCLSHADRDVRRQAFVGACDVLSAHSYQRRLRHLGPRGPPPYAATPKLQMALLNFVRQNVFVQPDRDHQSKDEETLEDLDARRRMLAAYCKLVLDGVLDMSMAADIFTFYVTHHRDFGDIIKETVHRSRALDRLGSTRGLVLALQQPFERLQRQRGSGGTLDGLRDLAKGLALTFGDPVELRECVVLIHRSGVEFAFRDCGSSAPASFLPYLSVLAEFSGKLLKPDKRTVLAYLQKHASESAAGLSERRRRPLLRYRASLSAEGDDRGPDRKRTGRCDAAENQQEGAESHGPPSPAETAVAKVDTWSLSKSVRRARDALGKRRPTRPALGTRPTPPPDEDEDVDVDI
ncbi:cohesin subunit SA-2 isoform X2 [Syngnathoides biaculeatus]|uniref:cohesin subunit SA-2 isoform X2 n=1 Tax=Syngnathoides biaculeatus TaxID=300417 RepID=UPI002ADD8F16|nr:cohesin subunit SA-2 isoform X2 [Syngnathoides biaculeatus]